MCTLLFQTIFKLVAKFRAIKRPADNVDILQNILSGAPCSYTSCVIYKAMHAWIDFDEVVGYHSVEV